MTAFHVDIVRCDIPLARYTLYMALYRVTEERSDEYENPLDYVHQHLRLYLLCRFSRN